MAGASDEALNHPVQLLNGSAATENPSPSDPELIRADVLLLLPEFAEELDAAQSFHATSSNIAAQVPNGISGKEQEVAPFGDAEWLTHLELKFVLRSHRMRILRVLALYVCEAPKHAGQVRLAVAGLPPEDFITLLEIPFSELIQMDPVHPSLIKETLSVVDEFIEKIEAYAQARLKGTDTSVHPLVLRLASRYDLTTAESDLFQLLFVWGGSKAAAIRAVLGVRRDDKEIAMELCGMSLMEVCEFLDDKRTHMAEGIVVLEQEKSYGGKNLRMSKEAVSVLLRRPLKTEQRLKFSKTELLNMLEDSQAKSSEQDKKALKGPGEPFSDRKPKSENENDLGVGDLASYVGELDELLESSRKPEQKPAPSSGDTGSSEVNVANGTAPLVDIKGAAPGVIKEDTKDGELSAYTSSLEYLDDSFQELALKLQIAKARHKEDMKEALNDDSRSWYDRSSKVSNLRELNAKLRFAQNRLSERMKLTERACEDKSAQLPRLEALAQKLGLDEFEKGVVVMLAGISISPVLKSIFEAVGAGKYRPTSDNIQVKDILIVFFDSFKEQVLARTYFYKSSRLVARGLIKLRASLYARGGGGDLMEQHIELDRRILDWIVGLDAEMNELVDGSHLYKPKIGMENVVLPEEQKDMLLRTADNFANFKKFRKSAGLDDLISYGAGLVILLCGPSGTGKTMTVNALAHHLGKRVLLVDFQTLHKGSGSGRSGDDHSADLRGLFRDAEMNDAIIFFDECESIFAKRERGGDKLLSSLLTEMERHEGIIMLATNRPLDLDEAMHRRITCVSEFFPPDHTQRRAIWKLASERLPVGDSVNWDEIALRYELTGGYIKNALVGALLTAISRDSSKPMVTEADIVDGCRLQMRGSLQMKTFKHRVVPKTGLDKLILTPNMKEKLEAIVAFQKARGVLLGHWGFELDRIGTACLFWGPSGTGKSSAAEAIGYELGRPLKVINCAQLVSKEKKTPGSNITSAFRDSQLMDAVLVLDDFQIFWGQAVAGVGAVSAWSDVAIGLLLHELSQFPGICILVANNVQGSVVHRIDPELTRRLKFLVEFKQPEAAVRAQMWKKMIPKKCPLSPNINYEELGRRFDFTSGSISSAIVRGAAKASLRTGEENVLTYQDLIDAAEDEKAHFRDEISELLLSAYI